MTDSTHTSNVDLHPRLVGQLWENFQGASALSVIIRLVRLNYLASGDIRQALGISIRRRDDVFSLLSQSGHRLDALAVAQDFEPGFVAAWHPGWWWPYANDIPFEVLPWTLRICPQCMQFAYHTLLFQMPGVDRCPWHGTKLVDRCVKCKRPFFDGFDEGGGLLQCICGHDHVDDQKALLGDVASAHTRRLTVDRYRAWASARQVECWLAAPEIEDDQAWVALANLANLARSPFFPLTSSQAIVIDQVAPGARQQMGLECASGLEKFEPTVASLPIEWLRDFRAICRHLSTMIPPGMLTTAERRALDPDISYPADAGCHAIRPWLLRLPSYQLDRTIFLHTFPMDGVVLRVIAKLASGLDPFPRSIMEPATCRMFGKWIHGQGEGLALLEATIRRVLCRGYADGCRVLLGQVNPDLYAARSTRPARRFPWVELQLGSRTEARIAWTRQLIL